MLPGEREGISQRFFRAVGEVDRHENLLQPEWGCQPTGACGRQQLLIAAIDFKHDFARAFGGSCVHNSSSICDGMTELVFSLLASCPFCQRATTRTLGMADPFLASASPLHEPSWERRHPCRRVAFAPARMPALPGAWPQLRGEHLPTSAQPDVLATGEVALERFEPILGSR